VLTSVIVSTLSTPDRQHASKSDDRPLRRTGATLALMPTMGAVHDDTCR
jgi:pantothenate synthetase